MAIKRLQIPEGAPIWGPTKPHSLAVRLWREQSNDITILKSGDYDVTPEPHKRRMPNSQQLTVMEDGTALYRIFTLGRSALTKVNMTSPGSIDHLAEGRGDLIHMPQDTPGRLVIGDRLEKTNRGRLFLFDIIIWSPDISAATDELDTAVPIDLSSKLVQAVPISS